MLPLYEHDLTEIRPYVITQIYMGCNHQRLSWMGIYIPLFYVDIIPDPCPNPNADLVNLF